MRCWYMCEKEQSVFYIDILSVQKIDCMYQTSLFINNFLKYIGTIKTDGGGGQHRLCIVIYICTKEKAGGK